MTKSNDEIVVLLRSNSKYADFKSRFGSCIGETGESQSHGISYTEKFCGPPFKSLT